MELNFKSFGEGQPLLILHGLFGMLDNWQTLAKRFAEDYQVFIIDQRNHGKSPHHPVIDYPSMAEDLYDFMLDHDLATANVLGHSMGGKTAMQFALTYPEKVNKLIVVDIAPKAYKGGHQLIFEALFDVNLDDVTNRKDAEAILAKKIEEPGVRLFLLKNLSRKKEGGYQWKMNLPAIDKHYFDILKAIETDSSFENPSLFIGGGQSKYIKPTDHEMIYALFPNSTIEMVENAGHWVHAEAPKELLNLVLAFLGRG